VSSYATASIGTRGQSSRSLAVPGRPTWNILRPFQCKYTMLRPQGVPSRRRPRLGALEEAIAGRKNCSAHRGEECWRNFRWLPGRVGAGKNYWSCWTSGTQRLRRQAFRSGLGSNLYELGTPDKVIQKILRHANVATTRTHYIVVDSRKSKAAKAGFARALGRKWARMGKTPKSKKRKSPHKH
jgi:integrase